MTTKAMVAASAIEKALVEWARAIGHVMPLPSKFSETNAAIISEHFPEPSASVSELETLRKQRNAALKLAEKWNQYAATFREQQKEWLAALPKNVDPPSYIHDECAYDLRAIFAPKEGE